MRFIVVGIRDASSQVVSWSVVDTTNAEEYARVLLASGGSTRATYIAGLLNANPPS